VTDDRLRVLERAARAASDDVEAWVRWFRALTAARLKPPSDLPETARRVLACLDEAPSLAAVFPGDLVWVEESGNVWIAGRWRGIVTRCELVWDHDRAHADLRVRVRPTALDDEEDAPRWRIRPLLEQRVRGLELSRQDRVELIERGVDPGPFPK